MGLRIDEVGQRVGVGRLELGHLAPVEYALRQHVALLGEVVEHRGGGGPRAGFGLFGPCQLELAEQEIRDLLGAAGIERAAGSFLISASSAPARCANSPDMRESTCGLIAMPRRSIRASTASSGRSRVS